MWHAMYEVFPDNNIRKTHLIIYINFHIMINKNNVLYLVLLQKSQGFNEN